MVWFISIVVICGQYKWLVIIPGRYYKSVVIGLMLAFVKYTTINL